MNLQLSTELVGENLKLVPLKQEHFESLFEVAQDRLIWEQHPNPDRYKLEVFKEFFHLALESKGAFLILDKKTNEVLGSSRFYDYNKKKKTLVIGFTFLARKAWGGLVNSELKKIMLDQAFRFVDSVHFHVDSKNMRSLRALEKIGAKQIHSFERKNSNQEIQLVCVFEIKKNNNHLKN
jgi:RimJ/RimL family protein N-acetyltransferase